MDTGFAGLVNRSMSHSWTEDDSIWTEENHDAFAPTPVYEGVCSTTGGDGFTRPVARSRSVPTIRWLV